MLSEVVQAIDTVPAAAWWISAAAAGLVVAAELRPRARQAWYRHRYERRLAQIGEMHLDEYHDHQYRIGDKLEPVDRGKLALEALSQGALAGGAFWAGSLDLDQWWLAGLFGCLVLYWAYTYWRKVNDPPKPEPDTPTRFVDTVPSEAITGFAAAAAVLIVFAALWLIA